MPGKPLHYTPEKRKYVKRDSAYVSRQIKQVKTASSMLLGQNVDKDALGSAVNSLAKQVDTAYGQNTLTIDHMVKLFTGAHEIGLPDDKRYVNFDARTAKSSDIIFRIMGMLLAPMQPEYVHPAGSAKNENDRSAVEGHLTHLYPWHQRKYKTRWDIRNRFWQLLVGRSHVQQSYLPFYWDKTITSRKDGEKVQPKDDASAIAAKNSAYNSRQEGYRGYMGPPVFVETIDPRKVFPIMTPRGPEAHVKIYRVQRYQLDEEFRKVGKWVELKKDGTVADIHDLSKPPGQEYARQADTFDPDMTVEYYEYLDDTYCYYTVGNDIVHDYAHNGGMKIHTAMGLQTGFDEYHLASMGVLWPVRNEIPQYDFMRTLWMQKAYLDVFPQLMAELGSADEPLRDEKGAPVQWNIEPGTVKQIRGKLSNAMHEAGSGTDFRAAVEMLGSDIDLATLPGLARGIGGAQQAGVAINLLEQSMRTVWGPITDSAEEQGGAMYEHYLDIIVEHVERPTVVYGETMDAKSGRNVGHYYELDPKIIEPFHRVNAHLDPALPIDEQGRRMAGAELVMKGFKTWDDYVRDDVKKSNPQEYLKQVIRDQATRAWIPKAIEDAQALGRVDLTNQVIQARGLDKLNAIGNMDLQALKAARATQSAPPGPPSPDGAGASSPTGAVPPPSAATLAAPMEQAVKQANGVQVTGANQSQPIRQPAGS